MSGTQGAERPAGWQLSARASLVGLAAIASLAAFLRAWNLDYGLPVITHPDEASIVLPALRMADPDRFDPDPRFYRYPALPIYATAAVFYTQGALAEGGSFGAPRLPSPPAAVLAARRVTLLFGVATVVAVYALGTLFRSREVGLLAAGAFALAPYPVLDGHYANVDVPMTFWTTLAAVFALRHLQRRRLRDLAWAAACVGVGGACKYTGLLMLPMLPVAAGLALGTLRERRALLGRSALGLAIAGAAFLVCAPYTAIRAGEVLHALVFEAAHVGQGHFGWDLNVGGFPYWRGLYPLVVSLPFVLGAPLYLAALAGVAALRRRDARRLWLLGAGYGPVAVAVFGAAVVFPRYLLPLLPVATLTAALGGVAMLRARRRGARLLGAVGVAGVAAYTAAFAWSLLQGLIPQNATLASGWISRNVPPGSRVSVAATAWTFQIPERRYRLEHFDLGEAMRGGEPPEWLVVSSWVSRAWERGSLRDGPEHAYLAALGSPASGYAQVASFTTHYLNESMYGWLDPYLCNQFESPDVRIYRRRGSRRAPSPGDPPAARISP
jgi:4-amino-4-deoxy-L-arabinose transferase-like glycosyltransferase